MLDLIKSGIISELNLPLIPLPIKGAKSLPLAENLNMLFTEKGVNFNLSANGKDLATYYGNGKKSQNTFLD